jgi:hypothetical protein
MATSVTGRVRATDAALAAIERLRARHGPLVFVQSGGCCDGSSPICLCEGELLLGPEDLVVGEVAGCPFYVDRDQDERWKRPSFVIDVAPGAGDSFSLEGPDGLHFVARPPSGAVARDATAPLGSGSRPEPAQP